MDSTKLRLCRSCKRLLPLSEFEQAGGYYRRVCREDRRRQRQAHYQANKQRYRASNARRIRAAQELVGAYLLTHPCADCGQGDPLCLDFHHLSEKTLTISQLIFSRRRSLTALRDEIDKCIVLCANCHRRRTAADR